MGETDERTWPKILVEANALTVHLARGYLRLPLETLPDAYIQWFEERRRRMYDRLLGMADSSHSSSKRVSVSTAESEGNVLPFDCCNKGVGFIPKEQHLNEFINLFRTALDGAQNRSWRDTFQRRVDTVSRFYFDREKIDYRAMTILETPKGKAVENWCCMPLVRLFFAADPPDCLSFQLNCALEIVESGNPRHTFVTLLRNLFEYHFSLPAPEQVPGVRIFWISEVLDKTRFTVV